MIDVSALKQEAVTYIEEEQKTEKEYILFDSKHWIWPIVFWAGVLWLIILMGMGVVAG